MIDSPVVPTQHAHSPLRPLPADAVRLTPDGLLGSWQTRDLATTGPTPSVTRRLADSLPLGYGGKPELDGTPGIESALVEQFRLTGHRPYLDLALQVVESRGHGTLGDSEFGPGHRQDHVPLRKATTVTGHVVSQLHLLAGATDVAVETGDADLLEAVIRLWESALESRTYLTGGQGSRHRDEAYGDAYELPPDRAYAETCASIVSFQLAWRLLLATGEARFADEMERVLHNGIAAGVSLDGRTVFRTNPLQARTARPRSSSDCCTAAVASLMASLHTYVATSTPTSLQLHLYGSGGVTSAGRTIEVVTRYPWDEQITVTVTATSADPWTLALRVPAWCADLRLTVNGTPAPARRLVDKGYLRLHRAWHPGDRITLTLAMPARRVTAHPRVDATRGTAALVRGPLVYCLEQADLPTTGKLAGACLEDLELDPSAPLAVAYHAAGFSPVTLQAPVRPRPPQGETQLYRNLPSHPTPPAPAGVATAIPYFLWSNREPGPMRVWIPLALALPVR